MATTGLLEAQSVEHLRADMAVTGGNLTLFRDSLLRYNYFLSLYGESLNILGNQAADDLAGTFSAEARRTAYQHYFQTNEGLGTGYFAQHFVTPGSRSLYDTMRDVIGFELTRRITYPHTGTTFQAVTPGPFRAVGDNGSNTGGTGGDTGGGTGGDTGGGGGGGCCWVGAFLPVGLTVGQANVGTSLFLLSEDGQGYFTSEVQSIRPALQSCARIHTITGITLTCSYSTPIVLLTPEGSIRTVVLSKLIEGQMVPVLDQGEFRWERVTFVEHIGQLEVRLLSANNGIYAAGDNRNRYIFTHNVNDKN